MVLTKQQQKNIKKTIEDCLRNKFSNYVPVNNDMPFHYRLLGKDRIALYSFMHSLLTAFGTSVFEPVAAELAKNKFQKVETHYDVGREIYAECQQSIQTIINRLTYDPHPNKKEELNELIQHLRGKKNTLKPTKVDLFVESVDGEQFLFDLKTAKPNKGSFQKHKQTLLEWAGMAYTLNPKVKVNTLIAIPYNPFYPNPYQSWTMAGMLDIKNELKIAEEFWDFLGGDGVYQELLDCFEQVGIELRPEIDSYFAKFK